jgi:non-homologous end joining protein Ku
VVLNLLDALKQSVAASQAEKGAQRSAAAQSRKSRARRKSG